MKRFLTVAVVLSVFVFVVGCKGSGKTNPSAPAAPADTSVAATVAGVNITMEELNKAAKDQLQRLDTEIYQIKKRALDGLIDTKLIEAAAKKKGVAVDKYLAEEIDSKITAPTEDEIKSFYESSKDRIGKPLEEAKGQIADFLRQNRRSRARADLIGSLRKDANVKTMIEPPRVNIEIAKDDPVMGDDGAKITLIEFSDYQCPYCKKVRPTIWRLMDEYKGKIRYVFKDYPLPFHKDAKKAAEAAHCAGDQKKYYEYNRKIFDNQSAISVDDLKKYAKELQLNTKDFDKCLDTNKYTKRVDDSTSFGSRVGVSGTPAYFINGIMLSGAMPYESFKELIDSELSR